MDLVLGYTNKLIEIVGDLDIPVTAIYKTKLQKGLGVSFSYKLSVSILPESRAS